jgi:hypothetical protein
MNFAEGANCTLWIDRTCRVDRPTDQPSDCPIATSATARCTVPALTRNDDGSGTKEEASPGSKQTGQNRVPQEWMNQRMNEWSSKLLQPLDAKTYCGRPDKRAFCITSDTSVIPTKRTASTLHITSGVYLLHVSVLLLWQYYYNSSWFFKVTRVVVLPADSAQVPKHVVETHQM